MVKKVLNEVVTDLDDQKGFNCVKIMFWEKPWSIVFWEIDEDSRFWKT